MTRPYLFLSANTPWVYALAQTLAATTPVTALRIYDCANFFRIRPAWPERDSDVRRREIVMPPGYAGRLEPVVRPLMRALIDRERAHLRRRAGASPIVVVPYPHLVPFVRQVPGADLVYYNLDDYGLYRPSRAERTRRLEAELVARARLVLCLSAYQVARFAVASPAHAGKIRHFPLGVADGTLNPAPERPPLPDTVGYVGTLGDRVDWALVTAVADRLPSVTFQFVGFVEGPADHARMSPWQRARAAAFARPNVVHAGGVAQAEVPAHYWRHAVNWMPYAAEHPFNLAACPTKILDAIASGRPFVSTPTPEAALYPDVIHIAADADGLARALRAALASASGAADRIAFARRHVWSARAGALRQMLERATAEPAGAPSV